MTAGLRYVMNMMIIQVPTQVIANAIENLPFAVSCAHCGTVIHLPAVSVDWDVHYCAICDLDHYGATPEIYDPELVSQFWDQ